MDINHKNYRKAIEKISVSKELEENILKMYEEQNISTNVTNRRKHHVLKKSGKVLLIAASLVVLSCASVFAYNAYVTSKLTNPAIGLNHSENVDVNGNEYTYTGGETLSVPAEEVPSEGVPNENLNIILTSLQTDGNLAYIHFDVTALNGDTLYTNTETKKSVLSVQNFADLRLYVGDRAVSTKNYFMFRVDQGNDPSKATLELTVQCAGLDLSGNLLKIVGKDYADTYQTYDQTGKVTSRQSETLYTGTWIFNCVMPEMSKYTVKEYTGSWDMPYINGSTTLTINRIRVSDLQLYLDGRFDASTVDKNRDTFSHQSNRCYLIYDDGTKIDAGVKTEGSDSFKSGLFDRHYMLENLVDSDRVVAIEFAGNYISLK